MVTPFSCADNSKAWLEFLGDTAHAASRSPGPVIDGNFDATRQRVRGLACPEQPPDASRENSRDDRGYDARDRFFAHNQPTGTYAGTALAKPSWPPSSAGYPLETGRPARGRPFSTEEDARRWRVPPLSAEARGGRLFSGVPMSWLGPSREALERPFTGQLVHGPRATSADAPDVFRRTAVRSGQSSCGASPRWTPFDYYKTYPAMKSDIAGPTNNDADRDAQDGVFDVKKYGATGDGRTDDTAAIDAAIQAALKAGKPANRDRNVVLFPGPGVYVFTSIVLKDAKHIAVQLLDRVTLSFDVESSAAKKVKDAAVEFDNCTDCVFEGVDRNRCYVQGNGPLADGYCGNPEPLPAGFAATEDSAATRLFGGSLLGGWDSADLGAPENVPKYLVEVSGQQFLLRNISLFNAAHFHLNLAAEQAEAYNLVVRAPADSYNSDGIHISGPADGVTVHDVQLCVGDDDFAINSSHGTVANVEIYNFDVRGGHGLSFGSSLAENVTNVNAHDGTMKNTSNGLRFKIKSKTKTKPKLSQIAFRNVQMDTVRDALTVDNGSYGGVLFGHARYLPRRLDKDSPTFLLSDVLYCGVTGKNIDAAGDITCAGGCSGIVLDDVQLDSKNGWMCHSSKDLDGFSGKNVSPSLKCSVNKNRLAAAPCPLLQRLAAQANAEEGARPTSVYGDSTCASCTECRKAL